MAAVHSEAMFMSPDPNRSSFPSNDLGKLFARNFIVSFFLKCGTILMMGEKNNPPFVIGKLKRILQPMDNLRFKFAIEDKRIPYERKAD